MTDTAFSYGGTTLATYGKVTLINDYLDIPDRRGENQVIPYRHGTVFARKYYDERKMTFGIAASAATATALETLFDTMRAKFSLLTQQTLSMTLTDTTVREVQATVDRPIEVERKSPTVAFVVVEFTLTSPFWRSNTAIADNTTVIDASPHAMTVTNTGTVEERDPVLLMTGPLKDTVITNSTNGCVLTYTGTIASPDTVTIQTAASGEYTAVHSVSGNVIGNVTHSGASALMVFNTSANVLAITDVTATTGTIKFSFYPPFL